MKKEVELSLIGIIILLIIAIILGFINYSNESSKKINNLEKEIVKYQDKISELEIINNQSNENKNVKYEYNCNFTKTFRIVNLLEGYKSETLEYNYVIVDEFQSHFAKTLIIPSNLKESLKENKWYEITYSLKGISNEIIDLDYIMNNISINNGSSNINTIVKIKETNKEGVDQLNQSVCSYERIITE